jgi:hypothetical protein
MLEMCILVDEQAVQDDRRAEPLSMNQLTQAPEKESIIRTVRWSTMYIIGKSPSENLL